MFFCCCFLEQLYIAWQFDYRAYNLEKFVQMKRKKRDVPVTWDLRTWLVRAVGSVALTLSHILKVFARFVSISSALGELTINQLAGKLVVVCSDLLCLLWCSCKCFPRVEVYQRPCAAQRLSSALNFCALTSVNVDRFQFSVVRRLYPAGEASVPTCSCHFENAVPIWLSVALRSQKL